MTNVLNEPKGIWNKALKFYTKMRVNELKDLTPSTEQMAKIIVPIRFNSVCPFGWLSAILPSYSMSFKIISPRDA